MASRAAYKREWYRKNKDRVRDAGRAYRQSNPEYQRRRRREWSKGRPDLVREKKRRYVIRLRGDLLDLYGRCCQICGDPSMDSLVVDHINEDGARERRETGSNGTGWHHLARATYQPTRYQTLCASCNMAKHAAYRRALKAGLTPQLRPYGNGGLAWEGFRDLGWLERQMKLRGENLQERMDRLVTSKRARPNEPTTPFSPQITDSPTVLDTDQDPASQWFTPNPD